MDLIGKTLGNRYEIIENIGNGGMATVYKAKCKLLNRYVAIKVLKDEFSTDTLFVKRFKIEAQSAASLTHPNIVSVYDVGEEEGINYIVMELLEGDTLKDYIERKGNLSLKETLALSCQIASALEAAHRSKIIHRDIKPQNIVLTRNMTQAKVTDFGIAKMSSSATITTFGSSTIGSVHYFSPEHAKGGYTDEKSDIYSLGIVMYEMATGELPFNAESPVSVALKQIQEKPKMPKEVNNEISDALNDIILKAMAKNTMDRYQTASELLDDLNTAMHNPNQKFLKSNSDISISTTQFIPVIGMKEIEENKNQNQSESSRRNRRTNAEDDNDISKANDKSTNKSSKHIDKSEENIEEDIFARPKKNKKKMYAFIGIGVVCLGILIGLTINLIMKFNEKNVEAITEAPDLIDKVFEDVKEEYRKKGLVISLDEYAYSNEYEDGKIISQSIEKGKTLPSARISVVVSKGAKIVKMIDVVGKDYTVAKYDLEALELVPEFEFKTDDKVPENLIISQEFDKDAEIKAGDKIKIIVSKGNGKKKLLMPNVLTMSETVAKKTLQDLGLKVSVNYSEDASKSNGTVLTQSQKQNAEIEEGTLIELSVNRIQKSKVVTIAVESYIDIEEEEDPKDITVKVMAKVEGVTNTIYDKKVKSPYNSVDVTVNGYTTAVLTIYIDGVLKDTQNITF
ncbi:MAG: Stk1 family PASTA domain-containing Ser/Thr kinase [Clostridia bacterium]|nr:Stk1 family PASTA domain-containing Ser/Thr kinase [Clostridia bacterium]MDD4376068.1 Stk1 family PASTA domain-containing Ser/Thr kinase [Clostridia bacterium]